MAVAMLNTTRRQRALGWLQPHRVLLILVALAIVAVSALYLRWDWLPNYAGLALQGLWRTIWLFVVTCAIDARAAAWLWRGERRGAVLGLAMTPVQLVFAIGFAFPFLLLALPIRVGLVLAARPGLR